MARQTNTRSVIHADQLPDGRHGCYVMSCDNPATRWIDMERYGCRRWLSTAYCDEHGDSDLRDPDHVHRIRAILP